MVIYNSSSCYTIKTQSFNDPGFFPDIPVIQIGYSKSKHNHSMIQVSFQTYLSYKLIIIKQNTVIQ